MKLLEKDIREKETTILSLSRQLDEIKLINLELFKKLQVRNRKRKRVFNVISIS